LDEEGQKNDMKRIKEKFVELPHQKRRKIIAVTFIFICVFMLILSFFPDFSPLFHHNTISVINSLQDNLHNTTPVSHFKNNAKQNENNIVDKPIQSTGCGMPLTLKTATSTYIEITYGKTKRRFIVYLPKSYENKTPHSLIVVFHGYASTPFSLEKFTHFDSIANSGNVILMYPEGTKSLVGLRGWNTGLHSTIKSSDVLFVSNMLNNVQSNLCVNPNQIYAAGFSNGGGFVAKLACQLSNRIAAFAPISGSYVTAFKTCSALRPLPIIEFHGTNDTVVPYLGLEAKKEFAALTWVSRWAKRDACQSKPSITNQSKQVTKYQWIDCSNNVSIVHYKIKGEGHSWPHLPFDIRIHNHMTNGNTAQTIWNFFLNHPLPKNIEESPTTSST
jgi:polyhydroxybutyrate depolymerase